MNHATLLFISTPFRKEDKPTSSAKAAEKDRKWKAAEKEAEEKEESVEKEQEKPAKGKKEEVKAKVPLPVCVLL